MENKNLLPFPIGMPNWQTIREDKRFFVDKTEKLSFLVQNCSRIFFSRPRRMGKTSLCSTLEELFSHGDHNFEGTAIYGKWPFTERYPVISLSFLDMRCKDAREFEASLCTKMAAAYNKAGFHEVVKYQNVKSFEKLTLHLDALTAGKRLVFLIDEWDYPLSSHLDNQQLFAALQEVMSDFYKWLRAQTLAKFVLITGIMRYRDVSLFTGKDIKDISMDPYYADLVGYTQTELESKFAPYIQIAATKLGITTDELKEQLKLHYDGFCFDKEASVSVYSPFSINSFFEPVLKPDFLQKPNLKLYFDPFWMDSSGASSALRSFLRARNYDVAALIEKYSLPVDLDLGALSSPVKASEVTLDQIMVQSGMLTIREIADNTKAVITSSPCRYKCDITNYEVFSELSVVFTAHMAGKEETEVYQMLKDAQNALESGDMDLVCKNLNLLLCDSLYDVFPEEEDDDDDAQPPKKNIYRTLFKMWLRSAKVSTKDEVANSHGRCDLVARTSDTIYAFELKRVRTNTERTKKAMLNKAEKQMAANDYCNNLINKGKLVVWVVLVICDKYRQIGAWITITKIKLATGWHTERHEGMVEPITVQNQEMPVVAVSQQPARKTKSASRKLANNAASYGSLKTTHSVAKRKASAKDKAAAKDASKAKATSQKPVVKPKAAPNAKAPAKAKAQAEKPAAKPKAETKTNPAPKATPKTRAKTKQS